MLETIEHGDVLELRLKRPPVNALDAGLIHALREGVESAPGRGARALVLSGAPGMFSAGLDVPSLLALDRAGILSVWEDFFGLMGALARSPIPTCAAVTGHSPAGGAVMAIFCDYRVMADGEYQVGLNEVRVGLAVPEPIVIGLGRLIGSYRAERLLVAGALLGPRDARQVGLVDELAPTEAVIERALEWCREILALPPNAMAETRSRARADLAAIFDALDSGFLEGFADAWFSGETQATLKALVDRLKSRSAT